MGWYNEAGILKGLKKCPECKTRKFYEFLKEDRNPTVSIICLGCGYETKKYYQSIRAVDECNERAKDGSRKTVTNKEDNLYS